MDYNRIIVEKGEAAMSILTIINGTDSLSELVNDQGTVVGRLDERLRLMLVKDGMKEKVVYKK